MNAQHIALGLAALATATMVSGACGSATSGPTSGARGGEARLVEVPATITATAAATTAASHATVNPTAFPDSASASASGRASDSASDSASASASGSASDSGSATVSDSAPASGSDSASASVADSSTASTDPSDWLTSLEAAVIADLAAGKPLVAQVHVPLCDNGTLACGNAKLGDGDAPDTNLYWATSPGFGTYFEKRSRGWTRVLDSDGSAIDEPDVLDLRVYRRTVSSSQAWRTRGAPATFDVYIVAQAWRGTSIDDALATYAAHLSGAPGVAIGLPDGATLAAGGDARLVAYVGHNRLMDVAHPYPWPVAGTAPRGMIAIACHTAAYMQPLVPGPTRVPLLFIRDFLFSNAAPLEGAVLAFARGGGYAEIRGAAAAGNATVQDRELKRVAGAFTNPASPHWSKGGE